MNGPPPKPADTAMVARLGPADGWSTESCLIHAAPHAMAMPTDAPTTNRPGNSSHSGPTDADARMTVPSAETSIAGRSTVRRPRRSEMGPKISSAGTRPAA